MVPASKPPIALPIAIALLSAVTLSATASSAPSPTPCEWLPPLPESKRRVKGNVKAKNVVLFTDGTNFDDIISVLFLTKSTSAKLVAIYMQGNSLASPGASSRNFFNVLHMMGPQFRHVPIFAGSHYAIDDELIAAREGGPVKLRYRISYPFGSGGILYSDTMFGMAHYVPQGPNAYDIRTTPDEDVKSIPALFDLVKAMPESEKLTFLSIGTLTPIAKMFGADYVRGMEAILPRVESVFVMGGAVDVDGNLFTSPVNTKAEFNIYNDPHAADWAFGNLTSRGVSVVLVPLDATNDVPIQKRLLRVLRNAPKTPEAQLAGRLMENLRDTWFAPEIFFETAFLWDPSAAVVSLHPNVVTKKRDRYIRVVLEEGPDGPRQGWTKPCKKAEKDMGICSLVTVIEGLDGNRVTNTLLSALQRRKNSAALQLVCL